MMKKKVAIIAGAFALAAVLGLGIYKSDASQADPKLNYDEVTDLISSQYPGEITEMELEKDGNRAVYEIEIVDEGMEYELKVDGNSGEILKLKEKRIAVHEQEEAEQEIIDLEKEQKTDEAAKEKPVQETKIQQENKSKKNTVLDVSEAVAIAQKEFPGTVTEVELDEDDGRLLYEIEIEANGEEAEFEIDAMTGEIIVIEIDD